jgi:hypothetical protein
MFRQSVTGAIHKNMTGRSSAPEQRQTMARGLRPGGKVRTRMARRQSSPKPLLSSVLARGRDLTEQVRQVAEHVQQEIPAKLGPPIRQGRGLSSGAGGDQDLRDIEHMRRQS